MDDLRSLIRDLLAEEIAAIRAELLTAGPREERVRVDDARSLTDFALSVIKRAAEPGFTAALQEGRLRFVPADISTFAAGTAAAAPPAVQARPSVLVTTVPASVPEITKGLVTERDIAKLPPEATRLRIGRLGRLTPLAVDEARRRGIRIERSAT